MSKAHYHVHADLMILDKAKADELAKRFAHEFEGGKPTLTAPGYYNMATGEVLIVQCDGFACPFFDSE
jgi:hypothetical protein